MNDEASEGVSSAVKVVGTARMCSMTSGQGGGSLLQRPLSMAMTRKRGVACGKLPRLAEYGFCKVFEAQ